MSACRFIDGLLRDSERLIGEAAQPQGAGKGDERADALINDGAPVDVKGTKLDRERHAALKMELRRGLVAQKVVIEADQPLGPDGAGRVLGSPCNNAGLFCDRQGAADVAEPRETEVQTGKKTQLAGTILERFRKREATLEFDANLVAVAPGEHRRQRQSFLEDHLLSGASAGVVK